MFVGIINTPRPYAWGSSTAIAELLGREPSGQPEAELWLGAHPGSPSAIIDRAQTAGAADLAAWIATDPDTALASSSSEEASARLPFLLKVLAADSPLSLQAHPTPEQAREGFRRENAAGIPLDAPHRNYKDAFAKPELIYALSPVFEALCGFRPVTETRTIVQALLDIDAAVAQPQPQPLENLLERLTIDGSDGDVVRSVFAWLSERGTGVATLVERVSELARLHPGAGAGGHGSKGAGGAVGEAAAAAAAAAGDRGADRTVDVAAALTTASELAVAYPDDPGIVISLMLNRVTLKRGEALYLPAGNIHAYLRGVGVELMSASDNVLRGGLTPKHVDVPELMGVLDFTPGPAPYLRPEVLPSGVEVFRPDVADFVLVHLCLPAPLAPPTAPAPSATSGEVWQSAAAKLAEQPVARTQGKKYGYQLTGPGIALCTRGRVGISGAASSVHLERGQAAYITPDEAGLSFDGDGELFLATVGDHRGGSGDRRGGDPGDASLNP
ncbi:MAG: type I phosphomannose isomerase catalytic subunit [Microbacteriaceae bacterium]